MSTTIKAKISQLVFFLILMCFNQYALSASATLSLNGVWKFSNQSYVEPSDVLKANYEKWDAISVPGNWDATEKYRDHSGKAYYQKSFVIDKQTANKHWRGKNIQLRFDAVYQTAKVWLNGHYLGQHIGGYTPFEFDIFSLLQLDGINSLVVMADNSYQRGAWWAWGGISRKVSIKAYDESRLLYQHISAEPDFESNIVNFTIKYKLQNHTDKEITVRLNSSITGTANQLKTTIQHARIPKNSSIIHTHKFVEALPKYKLWDTDEAKLYTLETNLLLSNKVIDTQQDQFGIRKFEVRGEQFYLNNQAVRFNGLNRVHDHPDFGNTEPSALVLKDMQDIKSLGATMSRLMHAPSAPNLLDICDQLGYLVIGEIPVWGDDDPQSFPNNPLTKQWLSEMIERDFNHPAIIGWSVGNELRDPKPDWAKKTLTPEQLGYINSMLDHVKTLDPGRLTTYVSLTAFNEPANISNEPYDKVDFISINSYSDPVKLVKATYNTFSGKPIFLSEVGLSQIGAGEDAALDPKLLKSLRELKQLPYVAGFSIWAYNDYRSNYKGTPDSGYREWGVVDAYRNKKPAYFQLKELFQYWSKDPQTEGLINPQ